MVLDNVLNEVYKEAYERKLIPDEAYQEVRALNWENNRKVMERSIPIFQSLIKNDSREDKHYYYGQLGYALKDKSNPEN